MRQWVELYTYSGNPAHPQSPLSSLKTIFFFNFKILFLAVLGLHCCAQAFSSCSRGGGLLSSYSVWVSLGCYTFLLVEYRL